MERYDSAKFQNFLPPKLPQIETVHLTTFEELHGVGCVFNPCFRSKNPITDEYSWVYTCRFLNPERAKKYYTACYRTEDLDEFVVWNCKLQKEKVEVLNIELQSQV